MCYSRRNSMVLTVCIVGVRRASRRPTRYLPRVCPSDGGTHVGAWPGYALVLGGARVRLPSVL